MKRTIAATLLCIPLAGCITGAHLIGQDGKRYPMEFGEASQTITTEIEGVPYKGKYMRGSATGLAMGRFGAVPTLAFSNQFVAVLTSDGGPALNCSFTRGGVSVMGQCQSNAGQSYTLTTE